MSVETQSSAPAIVSIVDDEASTREATRRFLEAAGYRVRTFASASEFLAAPRGAGCVLLDLQLGDASGLSVQQSLTESDDPLPVVFLSGRAGVAASVEAMKAGAVDFLEKSADGATLLAAIRRALAHDEATRAERERCLAVQRRYERLSPRERDVFAHLISGQLNKQVGFDLGISLQTTKIHRHRVLEKMEAESIVHLVRMADDLGISPVGSVV